MSAGKQFGIVILFIEGREGQRILSPFPEHQILTKS